MNGSINLGKIAGIRLIVHWTFLILIAWIVFREVFRGSGLELVFWQLLFILSLFGCVVLHELGHALAARGYGIGTKQILLLPIGGITSLESIPEEPRKELWVAIAGPLVNVAIAGVLYLVLLLFPPASTDMDQMSVAFITPSTFLPTLMMANIVLVVFNLIPAFPMDGGRIFRSLLALSMSRVRATQIAASLGKVLAVVFVLWGIFANPLLILTGIFIYFGASAESSSVQSLSYLQNHTVREAMMTQFQTFAPTATVRMATERLLASPDTDFLIVEEQKVLGAIAREDIIQALREKRENAVLTEIMHTDLQWFSPEEKLTQVYPRIERSPRSYFPVIANGILQGVINRENLFEFIMVNSALRRAS